MPAPLSNKKDRVIFRGQMYPKRMALSVVTSILRFYEFGKILDTGTSWRQNFWNTVCRRPARLAFFGPTFAFVKCGWVQTTAFRQPRTRHTMFGCKAFYGPPDIFVCHFLSPVVKFGAYARCGTYVWYWFYSSSHPQTTRTISYFRRNPGFLFLKITLKNKFDKNTWQIAIYVLHFDSSKGATPAAGLKNPYWGPGIQTPSYILSPLDSGPQIQFRMPISFSPFLPFGAFGNTGGQPPAFFYL